MLFLRSVPVQKRLRIGVRAEEKVNRTGMPSRRWRRLAGDLRALLLILPPRTVECQLKWVFPGHPSPAKVVDAEPSTMCSLGVMLAAD